MIQSNWIKKAEIYFQCDAPDEPFADLIPPGKLRAIHIQSLPGGSNARYCRLRLPALNIPPLVIGPLYNGFSDWFLFNTATNGGQEYTIHVTLDSRSNIDVVFNGNANEDNHPAIISFWYEPEDGEDDSRLAPLSVQRGGIPHE